MLQLTFKQTNSELLVRAAATVLFGTLVRRGTKLVSISDLAERPQYGFTASAATEPIGPKLVRITDLQDGRIDWNSVPFCKCAEPEKYLLRDDDLLFARTGATTGKTHLVRDPEQAVFASYLIRLRPQKNVLARYLHSFFQSDSYWSQISEEKEGSAQPNVNGEKLAALQIPLVESKLQHAIAEFLRCVRCRQDGERVELPELPPPLTEQRRVVARIEELATQIHEAHTLRHQAAEEAEALVTRSTEKIFADAGESHSGEPLGTHVKLQGGYAFKSDEYHEVGLPIVRIANLENEIVHTDGSPCMPTNRLEEFSRFVLKPGDILVAMTGATTGKLGIVPEDCGTLLLNQRVGRFLPKKPDELEPKYVYWLARGVQKHIFETAYGGAQPNISPNDIEAMEFPFPPLPEQRRIVAELDALQAEVDALKRLQAETDAELAALLPSILDKAFKGEF